MQLCISYREGLAMEWLIQTFAIRGNVLTALILQL